MRNLGLGQLPSEGKLGISRSGGAGHPAAAGSSGLVTLAIVAAVAFWAAKSAGLLRALK